MQKVTLESKMVIDERGCMVIDERGGECKGACRSFRSGLCVFLLFSFVT